MLNYDDLLIHKKIEKKLTIHAKSSLAKAFAIAQKERSKKIEIIHFLYALGKERGSAGYNILKDFGINIKKGGLKKISASNYQKSGSPRFSETVRRREAGQNSQPETLFAGVAGSRRTESRRVGAAFRAEKIKPVPSEEFKKIFTKAFSLAKELNYSYVGTEHFLCAILTSPDKKVKEFLNLINNRQIEDLPKIISENSQPFGMERLLGGNTSSFSPSFSPFWRESDVKKVTRPKTAPEGTPYLDKYCLNLNEEVETRGENIIGREAEINRMAGILGRKNKNNPLLIGPPGVGKTALAWKMAKLLNENVVPPYLAGHIIMNLDVAALVAGTGFRGEFEMRLKEIIKELTENRHIILFIDEIHNIIGAGNISGSLDLANILKPALSRGSVQIIGATTQKEYKKHIEKDPALERRFQPVIIKEPSPEESKKILLGIRYDYESFHNVSITDEAISLCVELSHRYIRDRYLPDKAIDVLDETASQFRVRDKISDYERKIIELEREKKTAKRKKEKSIAEEDYEEAIGLRAKEKELEEKIIRLKSQTSPDAKKPAVISSGDIIRCVAKISGIPEEKLSQGKNQKIKNVAKILSSLIIGQKEATQNISNIILKSQFGLSSPERPLGSFLLLGPSGVGKTHTARILAQEFFSDMKSLVRFDMSEFMERHSVSALIGSPAGYVGYGEGGRLTEKIRQNPYSVVLFDEIEKAHSDVFNILLQILEDGVLTDAEGTQVSFKNAIIILTTNIGTDEFNSVTPGPLGFKTKKNGNKKINELEAIKVRVLEELEDRMRPELLSRLDHIIIFNPLTKPDIQKITEREIISLEERLKKQGLELAVQKGVSKFIAEKSFDKNQGARLIRKNISEIIENKIAGMMVEDKVRNNKITVSVGKGKLKLI